MGDTTEGDTVEEDMEQNRADTVEEDRLGYCNTSRTKIVRARVGRTPSAIGVDIWYTWLFVEPMTTNTRRTVAAEGCQFRNSSPSLFVKDITIYRRNVDQRTFQTGTELP